MSGSTKGWINEAEREALMLLCEALELLGDRYAIYGFSGHDAQALRVVPHQDASTNPTTTRCKARIAGIRPQDYTRMGFAIRHLTKLLERGRGQDHAC